MGIISDLMTETGFIFHLLFLAIPVVIYMFVLEEEERRDK